MKLTWMLLKAVMILPFIIMGKQALAGCAVSKSPAFTTSMVKNIVVGTSHEAGTATAIGDPIILQTTPAQELGITACNAHATNLYFYQAFTGTASSSNYPGIFKTEVEGIGFRITSSTGIDVTPTPTAWQTIPCTFCKNAVAVSLTALPEYVLQFYAIGPVETGVVNISGLIQGTIDDKYMWSVPAKFGSLSINGTFIFTTASCTTPNITVDLGKHTADDFPSVGSTSAPVPFNFQINNCGAGLNSVSYTFKTPSGVILMGTGNDQYLTLSGGSTASGIGVQLLYDDGITAVPFNAKTAFSGYNTTTGGSYTIPMKARYVRTGAISAGTANSAAEFVMSYE